MVCEGCGRPNCDDWGLCDVAHLSYEQAEARAPYSDDRAKLENDYNWVHFGVEDRPYRSEAVEDEARALWGMRNRRIRSDGEKGAPVAGFAGRPGVVHLLRAGYPLPFVAEVLGTTTTEVVAQYTTARGEEGAYLHLDATLREPFRSYAAVGRAVGLSTNVVRDYARTVGATSANADERPNGRKWTDEQIQQVLDLYATGIGYQKVADQLGLGAKHVPAFIVHRYKGRTNG